MTLHRRSMRRQTGQLSSGLVFAVFAAIGLFFLFTEHRAHLFGWLPFLFLLACPLLHMFHGGHGGHGGHDRDRPEPGAKRPAPPAPPASGDRPSAPDTAHHHH